MIERNAEWRRFVRRASKTFYGGGIGLGARPGPLWLQTGPGKPRRLFYFTKRSFAQSWWWWIRNPPDDLAIFWQSWFPSQETCGVLLRYAREVGRPFHFVGDLDPIGLTQFADLRIRGVPVRYVGIDDRWLQLCRKYVRPFGSQKGLDALSTTFDETGLEHLALVTRLLPDLERLVGPESFAFLQSGRRIELEALASPGRFRKPFLPALNRLLLGSAKSRK